MPGSAEHLAAVSFIKCQLAGIPGLNVTEGSFEIDGWIPAENSEVDAASFKIGDEEVPVASAMGYTLPTNGSYVSGKDDSMLSR